MNSQGHHAYVSKRIDTRHKKRQNYPPPTTTTTKRQEVIYKGAFFINNDFDLWALEPQPYSKSNLTTYYRWGIASASYHIFPFVGKQNAARLNRCGWRRDEAWVQSFVISVQFNKANYSPSEIRPSISSACDQAGKARRVSKKNKTSYQRNAYYIRSNGMSSKTNRYSEFGQSAIQNTVWRR